jgi:tyrosinase
MNDRKNPQNQINQFLTRKRSAPSEGDRDLHALRFVEGTERRERFSPFREAHAERVRQIAEDFEERAHGLPQDEAVAAVIAAAANREAEEPAGLVDYAFNVWVTHARETRGLTVTPLELRAPESVTQTPERFREARGLFGFDALAPQATESDLDWYREDTKANEHHEHWHFVYPTRGVPTTQRVKQRHGEMFFYMHQQMLARYDTERAAVGLPKTISFDAYTVAIAEGYEPAPGFRVRPGPEWQTAFSGRSPGSKFQNITLDPGTPNELPLDVAEMQRFKTKLDDALTKTKFQNGDATTSNAFGRLIEPSRGRLDAEISGEDRLFGWLHGYGHMLAATIVTDLSDPNKPLFGVMADTATAIRDPFFYRWHRHVDDYYAKWQEQQSPDPFITHRPPRVTIEKGSSHDSPAIILAFNDDIGANVPGFDGAAFGRSNYSGSARNGTTDTLETKMCVRTLVDHDGNPITGADGKPIELTYLDQRPFSYFIRVTNDDAAAQDVTVRIFLAAVELADDRRSWIEMDKFTQRLEPGLNVIWQPAKYASIIKKPAVKPPSGEITRPISPVDANGHVIPGAEETNYCGCGWPYNLLLPRGRKAGMQFRLLVMLTNDDQVVVPKHDCGSMSYCGVRDQDYPDALEMGYPFHRRLEPSVEAAFAPLPHVATRDFTVKWIDTLEPKPQYIES